MPHRDRSYETISITLIADAMLAATIAIVFLYSKSRAAFSEMLYQVSDLVSGLLLLYAIRSSLRPADDTHPFGYGLDRFFWSFASGFFVFSIDGTFLLISGMTDIAHPVTIGYFSDIYAVLILTILFSGFSLYYILFRTRKYHSPAGRVERYHQGIRTVLLQDTMSIVSSVVAFLGVFAVSLTGDASFDGFAAAVNGVLLMTTGLTLSAESRELLIGKGISRAVMSSIVREIQSMKDVQYVREAKAIYLGPESLLMVVRLNFKDGLTTDDIEKGVDRIQSDLTSKIPELKYVIVEPES